MASNEITPSDLKKPSSSLDEVNGIRVLQFEDWSIVPRGTQVLYEPIGQPKLQRGVLVTQAATQMPCGLALAVGDEVTRVNVGDVFAIGMRGPEVYTTKTGVVGLMPEAGIKFVLEGGEIMDPEPNSLILQATSVTPNGVGMA